MTLILELTDDLQSQITAEAAKLGLSLPDYVVSVLSRVQPNAAPIRTGQELIAFWQREGVIGSRPEIADGQAYATQLRSQAETRTKE